MARYKSYNYAQMKMVAVSYERQILPGTFEHTLNHLIDHDIDLVPFAARYVNDETGAPAYDPAILLKVILYAYSRGVTSSRDIAGLCRENIIFMALSADSTPHFTIELPGLWRSWTGRSLGSIGKCCWCATRWV